MSKDLSRKFTLIGGVHYTGGGNHVFRMNSLMLVFLTKSSRVTARNVDRLLITDSTFLTIPWPGFYVYNATKVSLKNNFFKAVAPR